MDYFAYFDFAPVAPTKALNPVPAASTSSAPISNPTPKPAKPSLDLPKGVKPLGSYPASSPPGWKTRKGPPKKGLIWDGWKEVNVPEKEAGDVIKRFNLLMEMVVFLHARGLYKGKNSDSQNKSAVESRIKANLKRWELSGDRYGIPEFHGIPASRLIVDDGWKELLDSEEPPKKKRKLE